MKSSSIAYLTLAVAGALLSLSARAYDEQGVPRNDAGVRQHQPLANNATRDRAEVKAEARDEVRHHRVSRLGTDPAYPYAVSSSGTSSATGAMPGARAPDGAREIPGEVGWILGR